MINVTTDLTDNFVMLENKEIYFSLDDDLLVWQPVGWISLQTIYTQQ